MCVLDFKEDADIFVFLMTTLIAYFHFPRKRVARPGHIIGYDIFGSAMGGPVPLNTNHSFFKTFTFTQMRIAVTFEIGTRLSFIPLRTLAVEILIHAVARRLVVTWVGITKICVNL